MAGRFPSEWIDEVRDKSDIVSVVSEYVTLQKKGAKHWGLCPFHGEKTPSFSVDQEKQMFYCFGCHAGGNVITFVMNIEHMEFPEAVRHLAERAHMPIPELQRGEDTGPKRIATGSMPRWSRPQNSITKPCIRPTARRRWNTSTTAASATT